MFDFAKENDEELPNGEQGHVDAGRSAGVTDSYYGGYQYYGGNFINPGYNPNFFAPSSSNYRPNIYLNQQPLGRGYPNFSVRNPQQLSQSYMSQGSNQYSAMRPGF